MRLLSEYPTYGRVATWEEWRDATSQSLHGFILPWFISNMVGFVLLWISIKAPRVSRKAWGFLMILASLVSIRGVIMDQTGYHDFGVLSIPPYQHVIYSKFFVYPALLVFPIAVCQNIIGFVLMLSETPWRLKAATTGLIVFFVGIAPLGIGSAFPSTLIYATTMMMCWPSSTSASSGGLKYKGS